MAGFRFDGRDVASRDGDTLGSALHRAGVLELSRSMKYHRPRGLYCVAGSCASCLVEVDGVPNLPACTTPTRDGAEVRSQNRLGSARRDLLGVTDKVYRRGFDPHGAFTRPRIVNAAFLKAVRFMSGVGKVPEEPSGGPAPRAFEVSCDELIVGAGRAGLLRARQAAGQGHRILLVDEAPEPGGSALWDPDETGTLDLARGAAAGTWPGVELWTDSVVFGLYDDGAGIRRGDDLVHLTAGRTTVCAGRHDGWPLFENNDLPGVLALRGAQRLLHGHGVLPGARVVLHGGAPASFRAALEAAGGAVVGTGTVDAVRGGTRVERARFDGAWVDCDAVVCEVPLTPRVELLQQAGCDLAFRDGALAAVADAGGATNVGGVYVGVAT